MFRAQPIDTGERLRLPIAGLLALSLLALAVTIWVMVELLHEQAIVQELMQELPAHATGSARSLVGELRWQFRLTILVVLNLIVTAFAVVLLWRAYRASQESLRDFKALAGDILSSMDQAVITTDLDGNVTSINRRGFELLDVTEEIIGRPLGDIPHCAALEELRSASQAERPQPLTRDFSISHNGTFRTLRSDCQTLSDYESVEIGQVLQLRDVTEHLLIDKRMRRMERYLGLGSLAAGLHHEIKNPLAALSLHVQLLGEELERSSASGEVDEMLGVIRTEVSRVGVVLENFRDFASIRQLDRVAVDVNQLVQRQVRLIGPRASAQGVEVEFTESPEPLPSIHADRVRLEQVIVNLFVNALEAMPDGGKITVRTAADLRTGGRTVRIQVADSGTGIPESQRERVFDPYFTTKSEGTGMGLALCDKIIRQHGGVIDFRSSADGTVFEVSLPVD